MARLEDVDFLEFDNDNVLLSLAAGEIEDDFTLSQAATKIEEDFVRDFEATQRGGIDMDMTLSQTMGIYDFDFGDIDVGNFDISGVDQVNSNATETTSGRFSIVSDQEIENLVSGQVNVNTAKNTKWATAVFNDWRMERKKSGQSIPELISMDLAAMNYWLQKFVVEARKKNGEEYPPKSLYYIVCGLMRHCKENKLFYVNFFDEKYGTFAEFRSVLDARMKELLAKGLGTKTKKADYISEADEEMLWSSGVLGQKNATTLQYTVFFYACKIFGLRGKDEHRSLECSQFELGEDRKGKFIRFIGRNSKTYSGGLGHMKLTNKDIKHYTNEGNLI